MKIHMKLRGLVGLGAMMTGAVLCAQVRGTLVDEEMRPIENVSIVAMQLPDSVFVANAMSDSCGRFVLGGVNMPVEILLRTQAIGYASLDTIVGNGSALNLKLRSQGISLEEVAVMAPPSFELQDGKFVFTPGRLSQVVSNAYGLLDHIPMVRVDRRYETVELVGKLSVKFLVNGREPIGGNFDAIKLLQTTEASRIKRVEIEMATGVISGDYASVINIVMEPRKGYIFFGKVNELFYKDQHAGNQQLYMSAEYDRWQYNVSLNVNENSEYTSVVNNYLFHGSDAASGNVRGSERMLTENRFRSTMLTPSLGASVDLQHDNYLSLYAMGTFDNSSSTSDVSTEYFPQNQMRKIDIISDSPWKKWGVFTLGYNHQTDEKGSELTATAGAYLHDDKYGNDYYGDTDLNGERISMNKSSYQLRLEWNKVFTSAFNMKIGVEAYHDRLRNKMSRSDTNLAEGNLTLCDDFRYLQSHVGLSAFASWNIASGLNVDLGMQGQWYNRDSHQYVIQKQYRYNDFYLLPGANVSWRIDSNNWVLVMYSKGVLQPLYNNVNPIEVWFDNTSYSRGNPELKPQDKHSISVVYQFMRTITFGVNYKLSRNISERGIVVENDNIICHTPLEIGKQGDTNVYLSADKSLFDYRWIIRGGVDYYHNRYSDYGLPASYGLSAVKSSQWVFSLSSSLTPGRNRDWMIYLDFKSESPKTYPFSKKGWRTDLNVEISKEFSWGGKIYAGVYNLLDSRPSSCFDCGEYFRHTKQLSNKRLVFVRFDITIGRRFRQRSISQTYGMGGQ